MTFMGERNILLGELNHDTKRSTGTIVLRSTNSSSNDVLSTK